MVLPYAGASQRPRSERAVSAQGEALRGSPMAEKIRAYTHAVEALEAVLAIEDNPNAKRELSFLRGFLCAGRDVALRSATKA